MIYFDVTKTGPAKHRSGLTRVSRRLRDNLGARVTEISWSDHAFVSAKGSAPLQLQPDDWILTSELFSEEERPGFGAFVTKRPCRLAAIFHDAIPLKHPHITWPQSVARHPAYMKLLAGFDHVWAVSAASQAELVGFWRWLGVERYPSVNVLALGADFNARPRVVSPVANPEARTPRLLSIGIVEPRKNQSFLLEVCDELWRERLDFELHVVGRVNPHFGKPIVARLKMLRRHHAERLHFHEAASDAELAELYATARATVFPTIAEGCGLPLLESLWMGVPCVCSDLPVLRENADGGGCLPVEIGDLNAWKAALRRILADDAAHARLAQEAVTRPLPTWQESADAVVTLLE